MNSIEQERTFRGGRLLAMRGLFAHESALSGHIRYREDGRKTQRRTQAPSHLGFWAVFWTVAFPVTHGLLANGLTLGLFTNAHHKSETDAKLGKNTFPRTTLN